MAGQEAELAQQADDLREPARERAARGLHVAEARAGRGALERPGERGELPVQEAHADRRARRQPPRRCEAAGAAGAWGAVPGAGALASTGCTACWRLV